MNKTNVDEKTKPFRLVKYFTFTSLIVIFLGTFILSMLNTHWARSMQRKKIEEYAVAVAENLNHQIFFQFIIPATIVFGEVRSSNPKQFARLDKLVRNALHNFDINVVNIYNEKNVIFYSLDKNLLGKKNFGDANYQQAVSGKTISKQIQQGNFFEILLGIPKESKIVTFVPLRFRPTISTTSGPVKGVLEIVQDLSEDYQEIFRFQISVITTCAVVMGTLFFILLYIVKRGENIIENRARERLKLKEQLSRAEHLSSLGEMVAGISHEIRNPLGIIRSSAELLKKKVVQIDPSSHIPDIIIEESSRLNDIITDFLNYARPTQPHPLPCRVDEVLDKNISFLSSQIKEQGCTINKKVDNTPPPILADSAMLYQAFLNILINSLQAMSHGGEIAIHLFQKNSSIVVSFTDQGGGVADNVIEKIWDPFFTTKEKGTGLGLGIVKNIVESHHGTIEIKNVDKGARVTITLPLRQGD